MSKLLDRMSEFLAHRKGLLPLIGIGFIIVNLILQLVLPPESFMAYSNLLLHIGLVIAIFGMMLAWAL